MSKRIPSLWVAGLLVLAGSTGAHAQIPRSQPVEDPYAGNPYRGPMTPTYFRIGSYFNGPYRPILFKMGNQYSGPQDPNFRQVYFGTGYIANLKCDPTNGSGYYSPYYNNTSGTYYGPQSQLQQSLMILHEPPPSPRPPAGH